MPHSRTLQNGLFELRPGRHRITYFFWKGKIILLTEFRKNTNQTSKLELQRALDRMNDWKK
ncbi:hypothetical protein DVH26_06645 [Paenibacillus sp. H1-7]|nr:hypothetical protein DVH26_06645 [Paenibacillus sp. H1-7]